MNLEITEDSPAALKTYASVPSTLLVREVYDVAPAEDDTLGVRLVLRTLAEPYVKTTTRRRRCIHRPGVSTST